MDVGATAQSRYPLDDGDLAPAGPSSAAALHQARLRSLSAPPLCASCSTVLVVTTLYRRAHIHFHLHAAVQASPGKRSCEAVRSRALL